MEDAWLGFLRDTTMVETGEQRKELNSWLQGELDKIGSPESAAVAKARLIAAMRQGQQEEQEARAGVAKLLPAEWLVVAPWMWPLDGQPMEASIGSGRGCLSKPALESKQGVCTA